MGKRRLSKHLPPTLANPESPTYKLVAHRIARQEITAWYRCQESWDCNLFEVLPNGISYSTPDNPADSICMLIGRLALCPAFKNNRPFFQHALLTVRAIRLGLLRPKPPQSISSVLQAAYNRRRRLQLQGPNNDELNNEAEMDGASKEAAEIPSSSMRAPCADLVDPLKCHLRILPASLANGGQALHSAPRGYFTNADFYALAKAWDRFAKVNGYQPLVYYSKAKRRRIAEDKWVAYIPMRDAYLLSKGILGMKEPMCGDDIDIDIDIDTDTDTEMKDEDDHAETERGGVGE
jgi:hypothetical protein